MQYEVHDAFIGGVTQARGARQDQGLRVRPVRLRVRHQRRAAPAPRHTQRRQALRLQEVLQMLQDVLKPEDTHGHSRGHVVRVLHLSPRAQQPPHAAQASARARGEVQACLLLLQQGLQEATDFEGTHVHTHGRQAAVVQVVRRALLVRVDAALAPPALSPRQDGRASA